MGFNDFEAVMFQIIFNIVIGTRMEVQQVFTDNQDPRTTVGAVIFYLVHQVNSLFKAFFQTADTVKLKAFHNGIHTFFKSTVSAAGHLFIRSDFAQQFFQYVNHRQSKSQTDGGTKAHSEAGMHIVVVYIIVGQNRHIMESGVIKGFAKKGTVMGQTTVADIFAHTDGHFFAVVFAAL